MSAEISDIEPILDHAAQDLELDIDLTYYSGSLDMVRGLKDGEYDYKYDGIIIDSAEYLQIFDADEKVTYKPSFSTTPIALGVHYDVYSKLGWASIKPTWKDIAEASAANKLRYETAPPESSYAGIATLVAAATALIKHEHALTEDDIANNKDILKDLFTGFRGFLPSAEKESVSQALDSHVVDGVFAYENTLHELQNSGMKIEIVVPSDGSISADYSIALPKHPISTNAERKVNYLTEWLLLYEHQTDILEATYRRSSIASVSLKLSNVSYEELPLPNSYETISNFVYTLQNEIRSPGRTVFVIDNSKSMQGNGLSVAKKAVHLLAEPPEGLVFDKQAVHFRDNEQVIFTLVGGEGDQVIELTADTKDESALQGLDDWADKIKPQSENTVQTAMVNAYEYLHQNPNNGQTSVVVISDFKDYQDSSREFLDNFITLWGLRAGSWQKTDLYLIKVGISDDEIPNLLKTRIGAQVFEMNDKNIVDVLHRIRIQQ